MSLYQDYNSASANYDSGRYPDGCNLYLGMLQGYLKKPLSELNVLDAGCGTGNYSYEFLKNGVGKMTMMDGSEGMLQQAKLKVQPFADKGCVKEMKQHYLPEMPFKDNSFDAVIIMQVLHHLDKQIEGSMEYPNCAATIREAYRVLRPGGVLMIDVHTKQQARNGYWFYALLPKAATQLQTRVPPESFLFDNMTKAGFHGTSYITRPNSCLIRHDRYSQIDGPLFKEWRDMDSCWGLADKEEVDAAIAKVQEMKEKGTLKDFYEQHDAIRKAVGQSITIFTQKPTETATNGAA